MKPVPKRIEPIIETGIIYVILLFNVKMICIDKKKKSHSLKNGNISLPK